MVKVFMCKVEMCGECPACQPNWKIHGWLCTAFDEPLKVNPNDWPPRACPLEEVPEDDNDDEEEDIDGVHYA